MVTTVRMKLQNKDRPWAECNNHSRIRPGNTCVTVLDKNPALGPVVFWTTHKYEISKYCFKNNFEIAGTENLWCCVGKAKKLKGRRHPKIYNGGGSPYVGTVQSHDDITPAAVSRVADPVLNVFKGMASGMSEPASDSITKKIYFIGFFPQRREFVFTHQLGIQWMQLNKNGDGTWRKSLDDFFFENSAALATYFHI